MLDTWPYLEKIMFPAIKRDKLKTLQVNLGYKCNQQCKHCHVNAGPNRNEMMNASTLEEVKKFIRNNQFETLDITGGAPELHPEFRNLAIWASCRGLKVIDRCNLSILHEPGQEDLAEFLAKNNIAVVASMPCYLEENVDKQRGKDVFAKSILALRKLNSLGFGKENTGLELDLVYNPQGAQLPPVQSSLEQDYKTHLEDKYQIEFNSLLTLTNLPIARFGSTLLSKGEFKDYMDLLKESFNFANLQRVMCKSLISVNWQGKVFDCDFNQMLDLPSRDKKGQELSLADLNNGAEINDDIMVAGHCYGCVCGQGSSCSGALS